MLRAFSPTHALARMQRASHKRERACNRSRLMDGVAKPDLSRTAHFGEVVPINRVKRVSFLLLASKGPATAKVRCASLGVRPALERIRVQVCTVTLGYCSHSHGSATSGTVWVLQWASW